MWSSSSSSFPTSICWRKEAARTLKLWWERKAAAGWFRHTFSINSIMAFSRRPHPPGWAQQVWPHTDGWVAGGLPAGGCIVASVLDKGQSPLQKEEIGHKQLLSHLEGTEHRVNKAEVAHGQLPIRKRHEAWGRQQLCYTTGLQVLQYS